MRVAASLLLLAFILPAQAQDKALNLYSWSSYIPEQALKRFKEETGIQVKYDIFDSAEALDSKLLTGGSGYDVVTGEQLAAAWRGPSRPRRCSRSTAVS